MKRLQAELFADDFVFLEAPRWRGGHLWTPDVFDSILYRINAEGNKTAVIERLPPRPNSIGFLPDGSVLVVSSIARQLLRWADGQLSIHADLSRHCSGDLNDFAVDTQGRVYVGDFGYDLFGGGERRSTCLHLVEPGGAVRVLAGTAGIEFPNGAAIINEGRTLVVAETWRGQLTAFERDPESGELARPRLFAGLDGREPDGICADAEGAIWVPAFNTGEVLRVLDGGKITHRLQFPGSAVACQLGGEDGHTLFCTTYAGTIPDQLEKKRLGQVHAVRVEVPAPRV